MGTPVVANVSILEGKGRKKNQRWWINRFNAYKFISWEQGKKMDHLPYFATKSLVN